MDGVIATASCAVDDVEYDLDEASAVVLLQTANVLRQPGALLRLCEAVVREIPIVCVTVIGRGYDFAKARQLLASNLRDELSGSACDALLPYLTQRGCPLAFIGRQIGATVPFIIAVPFDPIGTPAHMDAAVKDLAENLKAVRASEQVKKLAEGGGKSKTRKNSTRAADVVVAV